MPGAWVQFPFWRDYSPRQREWQLQFSRRVPRDKKIAVTRTKTLGHAFPSNARVTRQHWLLSHKIPNSVPEQISQTCSCSSFSVAAVRNFLLAILVVNFSRGVQSDFRDQGAGRPGSTCPSLQLTPLDASPSIGLLHALYFNSPVCTPSPT
jgi:hypothetical protein